MNGTFDIKSASQVGSSYIIELDGSAGGTTAIGTATPTKELEVSSTSGATLRLKRDDVSVTLDEPIGTVEFFTNDSDGPHVNSYVKGLGADLFGNFGRFGTLAFGVSLTANTDAVEVARFTDSAYFRLTGANGGIQFNGDTASANALNDYEEGTWTPTTATAGYTISASNGSYTKIGRQVTIRGQFTFSAIDVLSNSAVTIGGLPFTNSAFLFSGVIRESDITGAIYVCVVNPSSTNIFANSMDGVVTGSQRGFAINENFVLSVTYFV